MSYTMTVSPTFPPNHIAGWYIFNTWLQRQLDLDIHLKLFDTFEAQLQAIANNEIDLIYANPFNAASLIREKQFLTVAAPEGAQDEAVILTSKESGINAIEDLVPGTKIASRNNPTVHLMGMMMLEAADLNAENTELTYFPSCVVVAKHLIQGKADVGFFLKEAYESMSPFIKDQLHVLVASQVGVIKHQMMVGPAMAEHHAALIEVLTGMVDDAKGKDTLDNLGFSAWEAVSKEDSEFMVDLMNTFVS